MSSNQNRLKKYIDNQKKKGFKRVSFFVNVKFWRYVKKQSLKHKMTIPEYLMFRLDFKP